MTTRSTTSLPLTAGDPVMTPTRSMKRSACGLVLVLYGILNFVMFFKFTPVYEATECATDGAELKNLELVDQSTLAVSLQINVFCKNDNNYDVSVMTGHPGKIFIGAKRDVSVGNVTMVRGSSVPARGTGILSALSDTVISLEHAKSLVPQLLNSDHIPVFVELHFDVGVGIRIGGKPVGIVAPFRKKCGMYMVGIMVSRENRLGPMICRDSFEKVDGYIPDVDTAEPGKMAFSAAQMDPERIFLGEVAKTVSTLGLGSAALAYGVLLIYRSLRSAYDGHVYEEPLFGASGNHARAVSSDSLPPDGVWAVVSLLNCGRCGGKGYRASNTEGPRPPGRMHFFDRGQA